MNRLIICNTYYQIIFSIQLRNTIFKDDYVTLLISDHSKNTSMILKKIRDENIFNECYYIQNLDNLYKQKQFVDKLRVLLDSIAGASFFYNKQLLNLKEKFYNEILSYNCGLDIDSYYAYLYKKNKDLLYSNIEEGILSYNFLLFEDFELQKKRSIISSIRRILKENCLQSALTNFYCYYPMLYKGTLSCVQVPRVKTNSKTANTLKEIFNLEGKLDGYKQKYIFFTSVYDFEGGEPVGEYELVCKIANLVGKGNLLVKTHPRDTRTIYIDNGFNTDKNSSIPWEAIQLSGDFSDKVFMTVNSGSVLSGSTMSESPVRTYFMYKLCDYSENPLCLKSVKNIEDLLQNEEMKKILQTVHIAEKLDDIL